MKIKVKKINSVEKELEVNLSEREIQSVRNNVYSRWQQKVEVPGYRKGKAPLELVIKKYSNEINNDLKEHIASLFYKTVLQEAKIVPISAPLMLESELTFDGGYVFKMKTEEVPKVKISKYKNLKLKKKSHAVTDDEVNDVLENMKKERSQLLDVERESLKGDFLIIDWQVSLDGKVVDKKENKSTFLDEKNLFSDLLNNLLGLRKDDSKEFELVVPDDFVDKKIAGKKCLFAITVKAVREKKSPVLNDDFAKEVGKKETLEDLKNTIKDELGNYKEKQVEMELEGAMFEKLISETDVEIPPQLLDRQTKKVAQDMALRLFYRGVPREEVEKQTDVILKEAQLEAEKQLKVHFILQEIAEKEGIIASDEDFQAYVEKLAQQHKLSVEEFKAKFEKEGELESLREDLRRQKVIEYVKQTSEIVTG
ncbi:MAG: trigger factor [Candidatus Saelkia tenebricola]|nr:trigger factor [Candidatus Saelkia tenebricola]